LFAVTSRNYYHSRKGRQHLEAKAQYRGCHFAGDYHSRQTRQYGFASLVTKMEGEKNRKQIEKLGRKRSRSGERQGFGWWHVANRRANKWQVWPRRDGCLLRGQGRPDRLTLAAVGRLLSRSGEAFARFTARPANTEQTSAKRTARARINKSRGFHATPPSFPRPWRVRPESSRERARSQTASRRRCAQNGRRCLPRFIPRRLGSADRQADGCFYLPCLFTPDQNPRSLPRTPCLVYRYKYSAAALSLSCIALPVPSPVLPPTTTSPTSYPPSHLPQSLPCLASASSYPPDPS
jgi:hypothetical protein